MEMDKSISGIRNKVVGIVVLSMLFLMYTLVFLGEVLMLFERINKKSGASNWEASKYYPLEITDAETEESEVGGI